MGKGHNDTSNVDLGSGKGRLRLQGRLRGSFSNIPILSSSELLLHHGLLLARFPNEVRLTTFPTVNRRMLCSIVVILPRDCRMISRGNVEGLCREILPKMYGQRLSSRFPTLLLRIIYGVLRKKGGGGWEATASLWRQELSLKYTVFSDSELNCLFSPVSSQTIQNRLHLRLNYANKDWMVSVFVEASKMF